MRVSWLLLLLGDLCVVIGASDQKKFCKTGMAQSPININTKEIRDIVNYEPFRFQDYDVIGTVQAMNNDTSELKQRFISTTRQPSISGGGLGARYVLNQFHIHWTDDRNNGAEHTIDGVRHAMELHFVHIREDLLNSSLAGNTPEGIAVVAVLFQESNQGKELFEMDQKSNEIVEIPYFKPISFLPANTATFYRYNGSLTTDPFCEVVIWSVMAEPLLVTPTHLDLIREHIEENEKPRYNEYREVQALFRRTVYLVEARESQYDKNT